MLWWHRIYFVKQPIKKYLHSWTPWPVERASQPIGMAADKAEPFGVQQLTIIEFVGNQTARYQCKTLPRDRRTNDQGIKPEMSDAVGDEVFDAMGLGKLAPTQRRMLVVKQWKSENIFRSFNAAKF